MMLSTAAFGDAAPPPDTRQQLRELYFDAARTGSTDRLGTFIEAHYDLDTRDESGYTALILAAYHGQTAAVEQLLASGANPCSQDKRGNTALMGAIFKGEVSIAHRLLGADCAPDERNNSGQTAAMYAALFQRKDILEALAAKGADLDARDDRGNDARSLGEGRFSSVPLR
nr:ankyrin repeat domain-containing protein [Pseudomonas baltica]